MKMKRFVKNVCILLLMCMCVACKEEVKPPLVMRIADVMREGVPALDLVYDRDRNVIQYGSTPIKYYGDQIIVGGMDVPGQSCKLLEATFNIGKGRAKDSHARCILQTDEGELEVEKKTIYEYNADSLIIHSVYHAMADHSFVREVKGKYVLDDKKRLAEVILTYREANDSIFSRCTHYRYDNNLCSVANLNLQAYVIDYDGTDDFFYFLLNLAQLPNCGPLPNDVACSSKPDGASYGIHANYRMNGENAIRIETLREDAKLLSRVELAYRNEE